MFNVQKGNIRGPARKKSSKKTPKLDRGLKTSKALRDQPKKDQS